MSECSRHVAIFFRCYLPRSHHLLEEASSSLHLSVPDWIWDGTRRSRGNSKRDWFQRESFCERMEVLIQRKVFLAANQGAIFSEVKLQETPSIVSCHVTMNEYQQTKIGTWYKSILTQNKDGKEATSSSRLKPATLRSTSAKSFCPVKMLCCRGFESRQWVPWAISGVWLLGYHFYGVEECYHHLGFSNFVDVWCSRYIPFLNKCTCYNALI